MNNILKSVIWTWPAPTFLVLPPISLKSVLSCLHDPTDTNRNKEKLVKKKNSRLCVRWAEREHGHTFGCKNFRSYFLLPVLLCLHVCSGSNESDQVRTCQVHILSLLRYTPLRCGKTQTDVQEGGKSDCVLVALLLCFQYAECRVFISVAAECLCNWRVRWSSSNQGRIIKTCWSLQSWGRGRFINDTLTAARGHRARWEMVILHEIVG